MKVANRRAHQLTTVSIAITLTTILGTGCHDPNDPNINPKARYALAQQAMKQALRPFNSYRQETIRQVNPQTKQRETLYLFVRESDQPLPEKFVVAYDPVNRRMHLRASLDSFENLETLPRARDDDAVEIEGENP
jgi:hypothetical protein